MGSEFSESDDMLRNKPRAPTVAFSPLVNPIPRLERRLSNKCLCYDNLAGVPWINGDADAMVWP